MYRSENVGMSSVYNPDEKSGRRKFKVSWAPLIVPGLVGPKPRLKSVGDGQAVNILLLRIIYQKQFKFFGIICILCLRVEFIVALKS